MPLCLAPFARHQSALPLISQGTLPPYSCSRSLMMECFHLTALCLPARLSCYLCMLSCRTSFRMALQNSRASRPPLRSASRICRKRVRGWSCRNGVQHSLGTTIGSRKSRALVAFSSTQQNEWRLKIGHQQRETGSGERERKAGGKAGEGWLRVLKAGRVGRGNRDCRSEHPIISRAESNRCSGATFLARQALRWVICLIFAPCLGVRNPCFPSRSGQALTRRAPQTCGGAGGRGPPRRRSCGRAWR